ncbi:hypothetical protein [Candidatus Finniella inopinata]|uniref:hypothetical protein n=1 Tax=Candidatus Finniella inopinata TaxID=1696036 RepID=UPI001F5CE847|nr:hypothetical protein [Candidatus Finniella inopinata]
MKLSYICLGLYAGIGVLTQGHAAGTVILDDEASRYTSISAALAKAKTKTPTLKLTVDHKEAGNIDLSTFSRVTIVSDSTTNRTITPSGKGLPLFKDADTYPLTLTLSDVTVTEFSDAREGYGGDIDAGTVNITVGPGAVAFTKNTVSNVDYAAALGGAINGGDVILSGDSNLNFMGNTVNGSGGCGGAVNADGSLIFSGSKTQTVTFDGNTVNGIGVAGGAISAGRITGTAKHNLFLLTIPLRAVAQEGVLSMLIRLLFPTQQPLEITRLRGLVPQGALFILIVP